MSKLSFAKYEGAGNDFILIDDRALSFDVAQVPFLCHRKFGIGADGVLLLQLSSRADFRMRIYNADGSEAKGCGNGLRCFFRYLSDLKVPGHRIEIGDQIAQRRSLDDGRVAIEMPLPAPARSHHTLHLIDTGVPHAVLFVSDVNAIDLSLEAPPIRRAHDANVNFATIGSDSIRVRTFERGVEGETLACGTGAIAVAAVAQSLGTPRSKLCFPGGELEVVFSKTGACLIGPARKVFTGQLTCPKYSAPD